MPKCNKGRELFSAGKGHSAGTSYRYPFPIFLCRYAENDIKKVSVTLAL